MINQESYRDMIEGLNIANNTFFTGALERAFTDPHISDLQLLKSVLIQLNLFPLSSYLNQLEFH